MKLILHILFCIWGYKGSQGTLAANIHTRPKFPGTSGKSMLAVHHRWDRFLPTGDGRPCCGWKECSWILRADSLAVKRASVDTLRNAKQKVTPTPRKQLEQHSHCWWLATFTWTLNLGNSTDFKHQRLLKVFGDCYFVCGKSWIKPLLH